jgi:hypothetical protein
MMIVIHGIFQSGEGHVKVDNNQFVSAYHWLARLVKQSRCAGIVVVLPEYLQRVIIDAINVNGVQFAIR